MTPIDENEVTTPIAKHDIVGLTRDVSPGLPEGLVGTVTQCDEDSVDVQFPVPGKNLHAQVLKEDVIFLVENPQVTE